MGPPITVPAQGGGTLFRARVIFLVLAVASLTALTAVAEPCLLVYPGAQTVFRYDAGRYEIVLPSDDRFDSAFEVVGQMLWDTEMDRIAYEVYQAPNLDGFEPSPTSRSEFYTTGSLVTVVIDGFGDDPRQLSDVYLEFVVRPQNSTADIFVDGERVVGLRYRIPRLVVTSLTEQGFYSNTVTLEIDWKGAQFIDIVAYSDRNGNRVFDGEPCFTLVTEDLTVPTESKTWGSIKALYESE